LEASDDSVQVINVPVQVDRAYGGRGTWRWSLDSVALAGLQCGAAYVAGANKRTMSDAGRMSTSLQWPCVPLSPRRCPLTQLNLATRHVPPWLSQRPRNERRCPEANYAP